MEHPVFTGYRREGREPSNRKRSWEPHVPAPGRHGAAPRARATDHTGTYTGDNRRVQLREPVSAEPDARGWRHRSDQMAEVLGFTGSARKVRRLLSALENR